MSQITVTTQAELDAALAAADADAEWTYIDIHSTAGVWLELSSSPRDGEVRAFGSASVRASDSASVRASGSASVYAFGSASVHASDAASVRAFDSASVKASPCVAVHLHSARATVDGGVLIDVTGIDQTDTQQWIDYTGADTAGDDYVVLYKAVDSELKSARGFAYPLGETVQDDAWTDDHGCGGGLHLSPTPVQASYYYEDATRFLRCRVHRVDLRPIPGDVAKAKARRVEVLAEVDIHGRDLAVTA